MGKAAAVWAHHQLIHAYTYFRSKGDSDEDGHDEDGAAVLKARHGGLAGDSGEDEA